MAGRLSVRAGRMVRTGKTGNRRQRTVIHRVYLGHMKRRMDMEGAGQQLVLQAYSTNTSCWLQVVWLVETRQRRAVSRA